MVAATIRGIEIPKILEIGQTRNRRYEIPDCDFLDVRVKSLHGETIHQRSVDGYNAGEKSMRVLRFLEVQNK